MTLFSMSLLRCGAIEAHCQMPCGIYNDAMVFDKGDEYVLTMYKGISVLNNSPFSTVKEKNDFVRWVINKEKMSDALAEVITTYFLQQKIKPGDSDSPKRLESAHKLLFGLVAIKQNTTLDFVEEFSKEWEKFKLMFHREGYECAMEKKKLEEHAAKKKAAKETDEKLSQGHSHDHDHDHMHDDDHIH